MSAFCHARGLTYRFKERGNFGQAAFDLPQPLIGRLLLHKRLLKQNDNLSCADPLR
jgi:hypothetical protein